MKLKLYQVDAFAKKVFTGNPAAVCPLDDWLDDNILQKIAMENNLAETAFYVKREKQYELRWFTPLVEVDLCGHATLAAAYVLFELENHDGNFIQFHSPRSGALRVTKHGETLTLNFPTDELQEVEVTDELVAGFDIKPKSSFRGKSDYMLVFENERQIKALQPSLDQIAKVDARGIIVTAPGDAADFVSRFFAPRCGVDEDPVTGSAHTTLTPYWAKTLNKDSLTATQLSARTGHLTCTYLGDRVEISGEAKLYLIGEIYLD